MFTSCIFPPFLSLFSCYMASFERKQKNKRARLHSVQLPWPVGGQNCKHFSTNGTIPPPCSRPTCPHFPSLRDSHRRPLALGSEELNRCIYSSSQTPPPFTSELTLSMQITLIQNSQDRKSGVFPVLWEIFSFREGAAGGSLHSSLQLTAGHSGSSQRKLSSEAQLDIHWFLNLNLSSNCPSKPKDWGLSK